MVCAVELKDVEKQLKLFEAVRDDELLDMLSPLFGEHQTRRVGTALDLLGLDVAQIDFVTSIMEQYGEQRLQMGFVLGSWYSGVRVE